jgi:hypothetical protein
MLLDELEFCGSEWAGLQQELVWNADCADVVNWGNLFECVGRSYGSTIEKGRSAAYPISILEKQNVPIFCGTRCP